MSIFDFFSKRDEAPKEAKKESSQQQRMMESLKAKAHSDWAGKKEDAENIAQFLETLERLLKKHLDSQIPLDTGQEEQERKKLLPVDALPAFRVSPDRMKAYACILPPLNGGKTPGKEEFMEDMRYEGITSGISEEATSRLLSGREYLHIVQIAQGTPARDGVDGEIEALYERRQGYSLLLEDTPPLYGGDFRRQNPIQSVRKGEVICRIKPPVPPQNGMDVSGQETVGSGGKTPRVPMGPNTRLSPDKKMLLADTDGIVLAKDDNFTVQNQNVVSTDMERKARNLDFKGDVFFRGNVEGGMAVKATGDVIIEGEVHEGTVIAGGSIRVYQDIKGSPGTFLKADAQIQCSIIENAKITAKGNIYAEVIANSEVISEEGSVIAMIGRGLIFGGNIRVRKSVFARKIGNISGCANQITIGYSAGLAAQEETLQKELENIKNTLAKLQKGITSMQVSGISLFKNKKDTYTKLVEQRSQYETLEKTKTKELKEMRRKIYSIQSGNILCDELYPLTEIFVGEHKTTIQSEEANCNIHMYAGQLSLR